MGLSLPSRTPTPQQEYAHQWWVNRFGDARCDQCESWVDLSNPVTSNSGIYCSEICYLMHEEAWDWTHGNAGHESGRC